MSFRPSHGLYRTLDLVTPTTRVWGILTAIVFWGVGVDLSFHHYEIGVYIILVAIITTLLETAFAVDLFLEVCLKEERGICLRLWRGIRWCDLWKKSILYTGISCLCFLYPSTEWLAILSGVMSVVLCILYLILTYKHYLEVRDSILADKEVSYDGFDELQEEIDDTLPEPESDNVGDQERILQV